MMRPDGSKSGLSNGRPCDSNKEAASFASGDAMDAGWIARGRPVSFALGGSSRVGAQMTVRSGTAA